MTIKRNTSQTSKDVVIGTSRIHDAATAAFAAIPPSIFKFSLGEPASIAASHEQGTIIGRAEYLNSEPSYLLRYKANDGRATEQWWQESALA